MGGWSPAIDAAVQMGKTLCHVSENLPYVHLWNLGPVVSDEVLLQCAARHVFHLDLDVSRLPINHRLAELNYFMMLILEIQPALLSKVHKVIRRGLWHVGHTQSNKSLGPALLDPIEVPKGRLR